MTRVTDIVLERYLAQDLSAQEMSRIDLALKTDPTLCERLDALKESNGSFFEAAPSEIFARRLHGRLEAELESGGYWRQSLHQWSLAMATFCICGAAYWLSESPAELGVQSLEISVSQGLNLKPSAEPGAQKPPVQPAAKVVQAKTEKGLGKSTAQTAKPPSANPAEVGLPEEAPIERHARATKKRQRRLKQPAPVIQKRARPNAQESTPNAPADDQPVMLAKEIREPQPPQAAALAAETSQGRGHAPTKQLMMRTIAPPPVTLLLRDSAGAMRVPSRPIRPKAGETLVLEAKQSKDLFWSYAITAEGNPVPVTDVNEPVPYRGNPPLIVPSSAKGALTIWLLVGTRPFSTEKILFDGFSYRSQDEKITIAPFFAIF